MRQYFTRKMAVSVRKSDDSEDVENGSSSKKDGLDDVKFQLVKHEIL